MAAGLVYLPSSRCQFCDRQELSCSMVTARTANWIKPPCDVRRGLDCSSISFRCRMPFFGSPQSCWLPKGLELVLSRVRVAADYSDSMPDSSRYVGDRGYHPLEELKVLEKKKDMVLTDAEIARTTVEANNKALLIFPGGVHYEPHFHTSWAEYQYVIDDYGDIFFELFDDENILQDRDANSPVTVLIGSDCLIYRESSVFSSGFDKDDDIIADMSELDEISDTDVTDTLIKWGMPDTLRYTHPLYFAKCLTMVIDCKYGKKVDCPLNGVSIVGCLRPAFVDEESYLRRLFHHDDVFVSDWRDESEKEEEQVAGAYNLTDGRILRFDSQRNGDRVGSTLYKLEIMSVELCSVYGHQSMISLQDFQDTEPDILANSASTIIKHINEFGMDCGVALKALCRRRKGLNVEGAYVIGVDSLGIDVRVICGVEARTLRFSFNGRAMSESAAEKKIKRMLFPRYHRKAIRTPDDSLRNM